MSAPEQVDLRRTQELCEAIDRAHRDEDGKARACVTELLDGNVERATELARKSREVCEQARALSAELAELRRL